VSASGAASVVYSAPREWTRVHPVSPFLGAGPIVGFVAIYAIARNSPSWLVGESDEYEAVSMLPFWALVGLIVLAIAAVIGYGVLSWRRNEYRIGDEAIHHRKGIVFRQNGQARLDRVEAVDVVQPLLARLFGLAQLNVAVAGGKGSAIELSYLRLGDAEALRNEVLALAAGTRVSPVAPDAVPASPEAPSLRDLATNLGVTHTQTEVPAAPERDVYRVPTGRLLLSVVLSTPTFFVAFGAIALVIAAVVFGSQVGAAILTFVGTSVFAFVAFIASIGAYFWNQINGGFHFTAATSRDGLRLRHGLLETRRQTVTPGRVQAVLVRQPWLWRTKGWYRITMNVAGYQEDQEKVSTLLPVGTLDDVVLALSLVLPDVPTHDLSQAVTGAGADGGFTPSPRRARLVDPWQWRQRGVRAGDAALLVRSGRWTRDLTVVPNERTQSLGVTQGPLQRLRHLASLEVHSTPGPVRPLAANLDADAALDLLDQQAARARSSRGVAHA
jgi:putative membrane protein